ncbi:hypothetical protein [Streptomyces sp. NPDC048242]|uniref:hypothetical protein n=1 Tax=Streptomyces sp. NPDC048242 TaxID=3155026 RepID=UPI0034244C2D
MARFAWAASHAAKTKAAWRHITCPLDEAVRWIVQLRAHNHTGPDGTVWWTTHAYVQQAVVRAQLEADAEAATRALAAQKQHAAAAAEALTDWRRRRIAEGARRKARSTCSPATAPPGPWDRHQGQADLGNQADRDAEDRQPDGLRQCPRAQAVRPLTGEHAGVTAVRRTFPA